MTSKMDPVALAVFAFFFVLVTVMGFVAAKWKKPETLASIDEWGPRRAPVRHLGHVVPDRWATSTPPTRSIAVPAVVYGIGAYGFFALPYTIIVYPFVFAVMPILWKVAKEKNYVTAGDVVYGRYGSRSLEAAVAATGVLATMPLHRAPARRHGRRDQGAGPDRRDPAGDRLPDPGALHLFVWPARAGADRLRQGHHDLHRRDRGGGLPADGVRRLPRDLRRRR